MAGTRSIAFVAHQETLDLVPAEARVLPLEPTVSVDNKRRIANRPEDFLRPEDDAHVEKAAERWAADWWRGTDPDAFNWNGVNLAECFAFALTFVVRDLLKTSIIVDRIFAREHPEAVLCDVPASSGMFRPYPHLDGIGRLAASRSTATGLRFEPLYHASGVPKARSASALRLAYLSVASRRGLSVLREERPLVAVGPYREYYEPVAAAWRRSSESTVVVTPSRLPIRSNPRAGLFVVALDAFGDTSARRDLQGFLGRAMATVDRLMPPPSLGEEAAELWEPLHADIRTRIRTELRDLAFAGVAFDDTLGRAAHLLLVETTSPLAKAMVRFARLKRIPTTVVQHGILAGAFSYNQPEPDRAAQCGLGSCWPSPQRSRWKPCIFDVRSCSSVLRTRIARSILPSRVVAVARRRRRTSPQSSIGCSEIPSTTIGSSTGKPHSWLASMHLSTAGRRSAWSVSFEAGGVRWATTISSTRFRTAPPSAPCHHRGGAAP